MPFLRIEKENGTFLDIETDAEGFLKDPSLWQPKIAEAIAHQRGITLTNSHWEVIHFARQFYQQYQTIPVARIFIKQLQIHLQSDTVNSMYLIALFDAQLIRTIAQIAGIPKPSHCFSSL